MSCTQTVKFVDKETGQVDTSSAVVAVGEEKVVAIPRDRGVRITRSDLVASQSAMACLEISHDRLAPNKPDRLCSDGYTSESSHPLVSEAWSVAPGSGARVVASCTCDDLSTYDNEAKACVPLTPTSENIDTIESNIASRKEQIKQEITKMRVEHEEATTATQKLQRDLVQHKQKTALAKQALSNAEDAFSALDEYEDTVTRKRAAMNAQDKMNVIQKQHIGRLLIGLVFASLMIAAAVLFARSRRASANETPVAPAAPAAA